MVEMDPDKIQNFEQWTIDKLKTIENKLDDLPCAKDDFNVQERLYEIETKNKIYQTILAGIWGFTGGAVVVLCEYLIHKFGGK